MSQQHVPGDVAEHANFGARLALVAPPLAALLYPFFLKAFHVSIAPVISGRTAEPAWLSAAAALFLLLAFAAPIGALLGAMALGEIGAPTVAQRRARAIALLAVAAPPLFVFLGVELDMLHVPVPDIWLWVAFWLAIIALVAFRGNDATAPTAVAADPARLRVAHGITALGIVWPPEFGQCCWRMA
jgi:hypothetical protein